MSILEVKYMDKDTILVREYTGGGALTLFTLGGNQCGQSR